MAKRELIDKTEVNMYIDTIYERNCNINEAYTELDLVDTISEEEIVKPYLEKLKARVEIEKLGYPPSAGYYRAIMKVLSLIDSLLTEKGAEE